MVVNWCSWKIFRDAQCLDEGEFRTLKVAPKARPFSRICKREMKRNKHPKSTDTASNESKERHLLHSRNLQTVRCSLNSELFWSSELGPWKASPEEIPFVNLEKDPLEMALGAHQKEVRHCHLALRKQIMPMNCSNGRA